MFIFLDKTAQSQATFYAWGVRDGYGSNAYSAGDRLIYQTPLLNPGNNYNSTSGEYTCPTTGVYMFVYSAYGVEIKQGQSHSRVSASLYRGGERVSQVYHSNYNDQNTYLALSHTDIVACQAGQRVWVQSDWDRNFIHDWNDRNVFGGVILYTT